MASEKTLHFDIGFKEFVAWATQQSWLCIHNEEQDFGQKYSSAPGFNTTNIGSNYTYLTPNGIKLFVAVKEDKVVKVNSSLPDID
jgi:hypothetical protein